MDSIKQVIVMRKDLNMRKGKMIAQGSHASIAFITNRLNKPYSYKDGDKIILQARFSPEELEWIEESFTKIVLYVNSLEELQDIHAKAKEAGLESNLIIDRGYTEFAGVKTPTCIAIGPDKSSKIDEITQHLPLL